MKRFNLASPISVFQPLISTFQKFLSFFRPKPDVRFELTVGAVGTVVAYIDVYAKGRVRFSRGDRSFVKVVESMDYREMQPGDKAIVTDIFGPLVYVELKSNGR